MPIHIHSFIYIYCALHLLYYCTVTFRFSLFGPERVTLPTREITSLVYYNLWYNTESYGTTKYFQSPLAKIFSESTRRHFFFRVHTHPLADTLSLHIGNSVAGLL